MRDQRCRRGGGAALCDPAGQYRGARGVEDATEPEGFAFEPAVRTRDPPLHLHDVGLRALAHAPGDSSLTVAPQPHCCFEFGELCVVVDVGMFSDGAATAISTDQHHEVIVAAPGLASRVHATHCDRNRNRNGVGHRALLIIHRLPSAAPTAMDEPLGDHANVEISEPTSNTSSGLARFDPEYTRTS